MSRRLHGVMQSMVICAYVLAVLYHLIISAIVDFYDCSTCSISQKAFLVKDSPLWDIYSN